MSAHEESAAIDWDGNLLPPRDLGEPDCRCASGMHTCGKSNQEEELIVALARAEELEDALGKAREQIERQAAHVGRLRDVCRLLREQDEEWMTPFDGSGIAWHELLPSPYTYERSDFCKLVAAAHEYEAALLQAREQIAREALDVYPS